MREVEGTYRRVCDMPRMSWGSCDYTSYPKLWQSSLVLLPSTMADSSALGWLMGVFVGGGGGGLAVVVSPRSRESILELVRLVVSLFDCVLWER
jgi:hypothetical protein